ncbi:MAG TPA: hypothetical protein PKB14_24980 [Rubrivivax sp.]|nr:hypothetical protein [Rubrivivax sp.]
MTLKELKDKYARLGDELDALAGEAGAHERRLASLMSELDEVHRELSDLRRHTFSAPTLRDAVTRPVAVVLRPLAPAAGTSAARPQALPVVELTQALPLAG